MNTSNPLDANCKRLVQDGLGLARQLAGQQCRRLRGAVPFDQMLSDAYAGLVRAAAAFEPSPGRTFPAYAYVSIRWAIWRSVSRHFRHGGRFRQFGTDEDSGLGREAAVADRRSVDPGLAAEQRQQWQEAQRRLERCLRERERTIVRLHILGGQTFEIIGKQVGLSAGQCGAICAAAVEQLRANRATVRTFRDEIADGPEACWRRRQERVAS